MIREKEDLKKNQFDLKVRKMSYFENGQEAKIFFSSQELDS